MAHVTNILVSPINVTTVQIANFLTATTSAIPSSTPSTKFTGTTSLAGITYETIGSGFTYSGGFVQTGTYTRVTFINNGVPFVQFNYSPGISIPGLLNALNIFAGTGSIAALDALLSSQPTTHNGGAGADFLYGLSGVDIFNGGAGIDRLAGGLGNDVYNLGADADIITDTGGKDLVTSTVTRSLATYTTVDNLLLLGTAAINGTGNNLSNGITGNTGINVLDGGAGNDILDGGNDAVVDTLRGGTGNDTYNLVNRADIVTENANAGIDTIFSTITRSLVSVANFENVVLQGAGAINATGNTLNNTLTGNAGRNLLDGEAGNDTLAGGLGNDTLIGDAGADVYLFNSALGAANVDTITSYDLVADRIHLENAIFAGLANGNLSAAAFKSNTTGLASEGDDRIVYNTANGQLIYDSNGSTAGGVRFVFATITGSPDTLNAGDFFIV